MDQLTQKFLIDNKKEFGSPAEELFAREFLSPIIGGKNLIKYVKPQYPFIDDFGKNRYIDFAIPNGRIAFEIDGETYHAAGAAGVSSSYFDSSLMRQNNIIINHWLLLRFSYTQLQSKTWRKYVYDYIKIALRKRIPKLLPKPPIHPNQIQKEALKQLQHTRKLSNKMGVVVMPTGTGKTYLSAMDAKLNGFKRILYIVHNLTILEQSKMAFRNIFNKNIVFGELSGKTKDNVHNADILFASKDTLRENNILKSFNPHHFDYIIIDEVHHSAAPSYAPILRYFKPKFWLGMTATPERTDQKDILELFNYNLVYECDVNKAIDNGFLVSYDYYGLTDNIDYSHIRYNGYRYNVQDLDKKLNIPKRNKAILSEYKHYLNGDKTIGFAVSINHARKLAKLFNNNGYKAIAIDSKDKNAKEKIKAFKNNEYNVAFTVNMFNEGVDIPNVRGLMFLRPTESKTIFMQQLGRGLRLSPGKHKVIVLDFIGNYHKANYVAKWISTSSKHKHNSHGSYEKTIYNYNPKNNVHFSKQAQKIIEDEDRKDHTYSKRELEGAYYDVKVTLGRKPTEDEFINNSKIPIGYYVKEFGSWVKFLKEIGEAVTSGAIYPQGLDWSHILYILDRTYNHATKNTLISNNYLQSLALKGRKSKDSSIARKQRQTDYKVDALMEYHLLTDQRNHVVIDPLTLTKFGIKFYKAFEPLIVKLDIKPKGKLSWTMKPDSDEIIQDMNKFITTNQNAKDMYKKLFYKIHAAILVLKVIYSDFKGQNSISKHKLYEDLTDARPILNYAKYMGVEPPNKTSWPHRAPFLLSVLAILGLIQLNRRNIIVNNFYLINDLLKINKNDTPQIIQQRKHRLINHDLDDNEKIALRSKYGKDFGTSKYPYNIKDF